MAKYQIGDKVRVRNNLIAGKRYWMEDGSVADSCVQDMISMCGEVVTIKNICNGKYKIFEYKFNWTDEMFENVESIHIVKDDLISFL